MLVGTPEGRKPPGRPRRRWIFNKWDAGRAWTDFIWLRVGTGGGGACECGNETLVSIKCEVFLD